MKHRWVNDMEPTFVNGTIQGWAWPAACFKHCGDCGTPLIGDNETDDCPALPITPSGAYLCKTCCVIVAKSDLAQVLYHEQPVHVAPTNAELAAFRKAKGLEGVTAMTNEDWARLAETRGDRGDNVGGGPNV